ncbi:hypothetical protein ACSLBF_11230 [Pseudoalteromonas sp. T1lg65]|uniref:hypothetical protein n=1 Tax=Pseudoalteromonas sp. T1lg65 TaxID=2077101 RepID=UPI003F792A82
MHLEMRSLVLIVVLLSGCATKPNGCSFDLKAWEKPLVLPASLNTDFKADIKNWYKADNGDFFYCKSYIAEGICGAEFEIHFKQQNGTYKSDEIMCMQ